MARATPHSKRNETHPPSKRQRFSVMVGVLCLAQLSVECYIRFSRRRTSANVQGRAAHVLPFFDRVATGRAAGAPLHFPCTFDSCRGFPGEGPIAGFDNAGSVRQLYRRSAVTTSVTGQFRAADRITIPIFPRERQTSGAGRRVVNGKGGEDRRSLCVYIAPAAVQTSPAVEITTRGAGGSVEGDRATAQPLPSSRGGARPRQPQGVTVPLDGLRARGPPSGSLATRGPRSHFPLDRSSQTIQPPPTSDSTGEQTKRQTLSGFRIGSFLRRESGRGFPLMHGLPGTQSFLGEVTFSDGRGTTGRGVDSSEGLRHANRPKGLLPHDRLTPGAPQVLPVPGPRRSTFSMEDRLVRHSGSASTLHEVAPSHHPYPKIAGYTLSDLYRRSLDSRPGQRASSKVDGGRHGVAPERGGSAVKTFKGPADTLSTFQVPRVHVEHSRHAMFGPTQENKRPTAHSVTASANVGYFRRRQRHCSTDKGLGTFSRLGHLVHTSDSSRSSQAYLHSAHPLSGGEQKRMAGFYNAITDDTTSSRVVDDRRGLVEQWARYRASSSSNSNHASNRRGDSQCGVWRGNALRDEDFSHPGIPHSDGTSRNPHQPIRVLRFRKLPLGPTTVGSARQDEVESSARGGRTRQRHVSQVWPSSGQPLIANVLEGSQVFRQSGEDQARVELQPHCGREERRRRRAEPPRSDACRLEIKRKTFPTDNDNFTGDTHGGRICKRAKRTTDKVLLLPSRSSSVRDGCFPTSMERMENHLCIPPANSVGQSPTEVARRLLPSFSLHPPFVDGTNLVPNDAEYVEAAPSPTPQSRVDRHGPAGESLLASEVASLRRRFIREFGRRNGIPIAVLEDRWAKAKNGYPTQYDRHFEDFKQWWDNAHAVLPFSPEHIRGGIVAEFLQLKAAAGTHHDVIRDISTSISIACAEATDGKEQPGTSFTVTRFMESQRRHRPVRRLDTGVYKDVVGLYQDAWSYGPDQALTLGHRKEKVLILLAADLACRPSDLSKLFRVYSGWNMQMDFIDIGVKIRFFYPKEVVPGSSRCNATGYYFSTWVLVKHTFPVEISTPAVLKAFLDASSGPTFALQHVTELDMDLQPLIYAKKREGKFLPASVDHISNIIKAALKRANMQPMTTRSVRGASPSKIVQLFPDLLQEALALGRWTNCETFNTHYQAPVELASKTKPPDELRSNIQQVLRWGFTPCTPTGITAIEYMQGPTYWVGKTFQGVGEIASFHEGVYAMRHPQRSLYHFDLMAAIGKTRGS